MDLRRMPSRQLAAHGWAASAALSWLRTVSDRAPYSRVYWSIIDDPKFVTIYDDDHHLAAWLRLLLTADQAHPASAPIPFGSRRTSLDALVAAGLIDLGTGHRFRLHGLDAERTRRKVAATTRGPTGDRTVPEPGPNGLDTQGLSQAEPSKAETSQAETPRDPADIYWQLTGKYPGDKVLPWIDDLTGKYGAETVVRHLTAAHIEDRQVGTLMGRVVDRLRAEARELDRKEKADEQASLREKRSRPRALEPWQEEFRALVEAQYERETA